MDLLLAASLALLGSGTVLLVVGRWRAVARRRTGTSGAWAWSRATSAGLVAALVGGLLLLAFVAIGLTMEPSVGV